MLEKLLSEIQTGGTLQPAGLASRLNTSVPMVKAMLEELERRGLIHTVDTQCVKTTCGGCALVDSCGSQPAARGRLWSFTQKNPDR